MSTTFTIQCTTTTTQLLLQVPYELKESFRALFKTAKWNPNGKRFEVSNTAANKNKWEKFVEQSSAAITLMQDAERNEASAEQLEESAKRANEEYALAKQRYDLAKSRIEAAKSLKRPTGAEIEDAEDAADELKQEEEDALKTLLPVQLKKFRQENEGLVSAVCLLVFRDIQGILKQASAGVAAGYRGKDNILDAQRKIRELLTELKALGFEHDGLYRVYSESANHPDKIATAISNLGISVCSGLIQK